MGDDTIKKSTDEIYQAALRGDRLTYEELDALTPEQRRAIRWGGCPPRLGIEEDDR